MKAAAGSRFLFAIIAIFARMMGLLVAGYTLVVTHCNT